MPSEKQLKPCPASAIVADHTSCDQTAAVLPTTTAPQVALLRDSLAAEKDAAAAAAAVAKAEAEGKAREATDTQVAAAEVRGVVSHVSAAVWAARCIEGHVPDEQCQVQRFPT